MLLREAWLGSAWVMEEEKCTSENSGRWMADGLSLPVRAPPVYRLPPKDDSIPQSDGQGH